ncbi:MAG: ABC transporter permease subunit [Oscillospiraceae bacterium]|nr:ABC transporter permease subunit [Oscillospiraceae bacterium]
MRKKKWHIAVLLAPFLALTALLLLSVWNVAIQSFGYIPAFGLTDFTTEHYAKVLQDETFLRALGVSLRIAVLSAVLSAVLGVLLSAALIRCRKRDGAMLYLVRMPILVPHAVVAVFAINLLSQAGLVARVAAALGLIAEQSQFPQLLFTPDYGGAIAAYLWKEIPFVAYFVLALMFSVSDTLGEAAENLGASPLRSFFSVTLPLTLPAIVKAFLIIFIFAFGGYELPLLLGATVPKALPVQAYLAYMSPNLRDRPYAMAMNGVILLLALAMAALYGLLTRRMLKRMGGRA